MRQLAVVVRHSNILLKNLGVELTFGYLAQLVGGDSGRLEIYNNKKMNNILHTL